jgi:hypothetical protein
VTTYAARVLVQPGDVRTGIDVRLGPKEPLRAVAGRIVGLPDGRTGSVRLVRASAGQSASEFDTQTVSSSPDGIFTFGDVAPGQYDIEALTMPASGIGPGGVGTVRGDSVNLDFSGPLKPANGPTLWARARVDVRDRDITTDDLVLHLQPGGRITGSVRLDGASSVPAGFAGLPIIVTPFLGRDDLGGIPLTPVDEGLKFTTVGLPPGVYELAPFTRFVSPWSLESIRHEEREVTGRPLELVGGDLTGVEITLTDAPIAVNGTVRNRQGQPVPGATVVLFSADSSLRRTMRWGGSRVRSAIADAAGRYVLSNLLPGEYFAAAVTLDRALLVSFPRQFDRLLAVAVAVRLEKRQTRVLDLVTSG